MREIKDDFVKLVKAKPVLNLSNLGHKAVNYATYTERLKASRRGMKAPKEILDDPVRRAIIEKKAEQLGQKPHQILGIYCGLVSSFRPMTAKYLCRRFNATSVLDPCAGWGGRLVGATAAGCRYIGIDSNTDLKEGYDRLIQLTGGDVTLIWSPAESVDFSQLKYDFVLSCPPYADLETYMNVPTYQNWKEEFFIPVFSRAYASLQEIGYMALCLPESLYVVLAEHLGECHETINIPIRCRDKRRTKTETVYCWYK